MKSITICPAIDGIGKIYVSVLKKSVEGITDEKMKKIKVLKEPIKLQVPVEEEGELYVNVYKDESSNNLLEQVIVQY